MQMREARQQQEARKAFINFINRNGIQPITRSETPGSKTITVRWQKGGRSKGWSQNHLIAGSKTVCGKAIDHPTHYSQAKANDQPVTCAACRRVS